MAEKLSNLGFEGEGVKLFAKTGIPDIALSVIVEYYAMYAADNCTDQAKFVLSAFNESGESFASIRGVARMSGKDDRIIRRFIGAAQIDVINVEIKTEGGLQGAALLSESSICKILAKYNPDRLEQFAMLGIRTALHQIAGYKQPSNS